jgi:phage baseplate assembly protein W
MAIQKRTDILGRDLMALYRVTDGRHEDIDLERKNRFIKGATVWDLAAHEGLENAIQAVIHRIKTVKGELSGLGHPEYGSRHHELIGQPNTENNRNLVKLYILQALSREPRIEKVHKAEILFDRKRTADRVEISLTLSFIGVQTPQNLVIPFSFEEAL